MSSLLHLLLDGHPCPPRIPGFAAGERCEHRKRIPSFRALRKFRVSRPRNSGFRAPPFPILGFAAWQEFRVSDQNFGFRGRNPSGFRPRIPGFTWNSWVRFSTTPRFADLLEPISNYTWIVPSIRQPPQFTENGPTGFATVLDASVDSCRCA